MFESNDGRRAPKPELEARDGVSAQPGWSALNLGRVRRRCHGVAGIPGRLPADSQQSVVRIRSRSETGAEPIFVVSIPDSTGMQNGRGNFTRVYARGTLLTITAPAAVGQSRFDAWYRGDARVDGGSGSTTLNIGALNDDSFIYEARYLH